MWQSLFLLTRSHTGTTTTTPDTHFFLAGGPQLYLYLSSSYSPCHLGSMRNKLKKGQRSRPETRYYQGSVLINHGNSHPPNSWFVGNKCAHCLRHFKLGISLTALKSILGWLFIWTCVYIIFYIKQYIVYTYILGSCISPETKRRYWSYLSVYSQLLTWHLLIAVTQQTFPELNWLGPFISICNLHITHLVGV